MPIHELVCAVQKYEWGKSGREGSLVYELAHSKQQQMKDDAAYDHPHAELWMGTHPNGPSHVVVSGDEGSPAMTRVLLSDFLKQKQQQMTKEEEEGGTAAAAVAAWMGQESAEDQEKGQLPFLFKVLSVRTALSIQCHPDKQRAQHMHHTSPDRYKDPNHKPELCVALTDDFEALGGFRPWGEIAAHVQRVAPLRSLLLLHSAKNKKAGEGEEDVTNVAAVIAGLSDAGEAASEGKGDVQRQQAIRTLFTALMQSDPEDVAKHLRQIVEQAESGDKDHTNPTDRLVVRLNGQYPDDVGCLAAYFLNHVTLQEGEALFLGPNEPHAYISGDLIECMACSDNVVRAGLTPKFRDVDALCEMLTYRDDSLETTMRLHRGVQMGEHLALYQPPEEFPEFQVYRVSGNVKAVPLRNVSIAIVVRGKGRMQVLKEGEVEEVEATVDVSRGQVFVIRGGGAKLAVQFDEENQGSHEDGQSPVIFIASSRD